MKPTIERPNERSVMQFFTPDLYLRFNSTDDETADCANEEWDAAVAAYREKLEKARPWMPTSVSELADLNLHDAEVIELDKSAVSSHWPNSVVVWPFCMKQEGRMRLLLYYLWDTPRTRPAPANWPYSAQRRHWLCDEIEMEQSPKFLHRILFSDGGTLEVPFLSVACFTATAAGMAAWGVA